MIPVLVFQDFFLFFSHIMFTEKHHHFWKNEGNRQLTFYCLFTYNMQIFNILLYLESIFQDLKISLLPT